MKRFQAPSSSGIRDFLGTENRKLRVKLGFLGFPFPAGSVRTPAGNKTGNTAPNPCFYSQKNHLPTLVPHFGEIPPESDEEKNGKNREWNSRGARNRDFSTPALIKKKPSGFSSRFPCFWGKGFEFQGFLISYREKDTQSAGGAEIPRNSLENEADFQFRFLNLPKFQVFPRLSLPEDSRRGLKR